jgi:chorismate mutase-like protein
MNDLEVWRQKIDDIDKQLVRLLNERTTCATEIGKIKIMLGLDAYSPERELEVMRNVTGWNKGPLSSAAVRRLFERIIDEARSVERVYMHEQKKKPKR